MKGQSYLRERTRLYKVIVCKATVMVRVMGGLKVKVMVRPWVVWRSRLWSGSWWSKGQGYGQGQGWFKGQGNLHSTLGLGSDLLVHLNEATAVVDEHAVLVALVYIDAKDEVQRLGLTQRPTRTYGNSVNTLYQLHYTNKQTFQH